jgi:hypothetical protein
MMHIAFTKLQAVGVAAIVLPKLLRPCMAVHTGSSAQYLLGVQAVVLAYSSDCCQQQGPLPVVRTPWHR